MDRSTSEKNCGQIAVCAFDTTQVKEISGELTMPDYYPEIRKVISVTAEALPDTKYLSDSSLEIGGCVAFSLLYIGDDGALSSVPYVAEYAQSFPVDHSFQSSSSEISVQSTAESVFCRPLAPRTVSLKAKVRSRVCADTSEDCTMKCTCEDSMPLSGGRKKSIERLEKELPTAKKYCFVTSGSVSGEEQLACGVKPILCKGELLVTSTKAGNESVTVSGDVMISCLIQSSDGSYSSVWKKLPFEEQAGAEGIDSSFVCAAHGRVASVSASTDDDGKLSISCEYDIDIVCAKSMTASIVDDVYSTAYSLSPARREMNAKSLICLENKVIPVTAEGRRKAERTDSDKLIYCYADGKIERADMSEGKLHFSGAVTFKMLIARDGDVITEELTAPVAAEIPTSSAKQGDAIWHASISPSRIECTLEDSVIRAKCDLHAFLEAMKETKCAPVTEASIGCIDVSAKDNTCIRICYPEKGKRIWDIAKECRASVSECERQNHLNRCDLSDGAPLIIK